MKGREGGVYKALYIIFTELVLDTGNGSVLGDSSPKTVGSVCCTERERFCPFSVGELVLYHCYSSE